MVIFINLGYANKSRQFEYNDHGETIGRTFSSFWQGVFLQDSVFRPEGAFAGDGVHRNGQILREAGYREIAPTEVHEFLYRRG
jgi:hypothetical protein